MGLTNNSSGSEPTPRDDEEWLHMVVSIHPLARGEGLAYLMSTVARGDGAVDLSCPLTRYYAEAGTPPGRFIGGGLKHVDGGRGVAVGAEVTEEHLTNMLAVIGDPITGEPLGARSRTVPAGSKKIAGFDLTFSPPKSYSVIWAVADAGMQAGIYDMVQDALDLTLEFAEREVFFSRSGSGGVVREAIDGGVIAARFDHWDSREGDPQLHIHTTVMNAVKSASDGKWRTLDSRGLHKGTVTLSQVNQGIMQDLSAARFGWSFTPRTRGHADNPKWEVAGVRDEMNGEFSKRSTALNAEKDRQVDAFKAKYGRAPKRREIARMRTVATLLTRPAKQHRSLHELTESWRMRMRAYLPKQYGTGAEADTVAWVYGLREEAEKARQDGTGTVLVRQSDFDADRIRVIATAAVKTAADKWPTFTRENLRAEVHRTLHAYVFPDPRERISLGEVITDDAVSLTVNLSRGSVGHVPGRFRAADGTSKLIADTDHILTTAEILHAEQRLLAHGRNITGPRIADDVVDAATSVPLPGKDGKPGPTPSLNQAEAVHQIATSGRVLDVLVGPAGAGKTTSMAALRAAWEAVHGPGSVVGLATSQKAAKVLEADLGIACENTAKWLTRQTKVVPAKLELAAKWRARATRATTEIARTRCLAVAAKYEAQAAALQPRPGQLYIHDESSLAGTFMLDDLLTRVAAAGGKVLLAGDPEQLSAVNAGGALDMLVRDRIATAETPGDRLSGGAAAGVAGGVAGQQFYPELTDIYRFNNPWEAAATLRLRAGDESVVSTYLEHGRIVGGHRDQMLDQLYGAWHSDTRDGLHSIMVAADRATVLDLNNRAQADRIAAGEVQEPPRHAPRLRDGSTPGIGDRVTTRQNRSDLLAGTHAVTNGDEWTVTAINKDGSLTVRRTTQPLGATHQNRTADDGPGRAGARAAQAQRKAARREAMNSKYDSVVLPADYVAGDLELAYATTAHRSQGATVDTAHAMVTAGSTRQVLYVGASRARDTNMLYVDTHPDNTPETSHGHPEELSVEQVLTGVLRNDGSDRSATVTAAQLADDRGRMPTLYRDFVTFGAAGQIDRLLAQLDAAATPSDSRSPDAGPLPSAAVPDPEQVREQALRSPHLDTLGDVVRAAENVGLDPVAQLRTALHDSTKEQQDTDLRPDARLGARPDVRPGAEPGDAAAVTDGAGDAGVPVASEQEPSVDLIGRLTLSIRDQLLAEGHSLRGKQVRTVLGLFERPRTLDPDLERAIDDRIAAMEARAARLVDDALTAAVPPAWITELGTPPAAPAARAAWTGHARTVAAYLDLYGHHGPAHTMLEAAAGPTQKGHARAAMNAVKRGAYIAEMHGPADSAASSRPGGLSSDPARVRTGGIESEPAARAAASTTDRIGREGPAL